MIRFYDKIPDMECLAGDTLQSFIISVNAADGLDNCRLQCILATWDSPEQLVLCKECTATEGGFSVTLTSADTQGLAGLFRIHFRFIGADGLSRRKISGVLNVIPVPQGG